MATKKSGNVYFNKGGFGSKWVSKYLHISATSEDSPTNPSRELSLYDDKASFYAKKKSIVSKSLIKTCEINKSSHDSNKKFGFKIVTKKKKLEFSVNEESKRKEWIDFAMGRTKTIRGMKFDDIMNDDQFEKDLDAYISQSGLPDTEAQKLRALPKATLGKIIDEWRKSKVST